MNWQAKTGENNKELDSKLDILHHCYESNQQFYSRMRRKE